MKYQLDIQREREREKCPDYDGNRKQLKKEMIERYENFDFDFSCPNDNEEYQPFIDLIKLLFQMKDEPLKPGEIRNNEVFWDKFRNDPFAIECMKLAEEKLKEVDQ